MIELRDASMADAERLLDIYDYYVKNTAITFEYETPTLDEFRSRMARVTKRYPYLVILQDGQIQGYAYAGPFVGRAAYDWSCEMTIYLDHHARKQGLGRQLYTAMEQALKKMGILNLYACIGSLIQGHDNILIAKRIHLCNDAAFLAVYRMLFFPAD